MKKFQAALAEFGKEYVDAAMGQEKAEQKLAEYSSYSSDDAEALVWVKSFRNK